MQKVIEILEKKCEVEYRASFCAGPCYLLHIIYNNEVYHAVVYLDSLGTIKKSHRTAKTILNELHRMSTGDCGRYKYIINMK